MSRMNTLYAAAVALIIATPAVAQDGASPWDLKERNAYVLDMQNKMWSTKVGDKGMNWMMRRAKQVPRGTVFFMANGRLMMSKAPMFDRAGNFMAGGV